MLVNNEIGTVEPICELAAVAHASTALFHTDAVQAVGHIPIDVNELCVICCQLPLINLMDQKESVPICSQRNASVTLCRWRRTGVWNACWHRKCCEYRWYGNGS